MVSETNIFTEGENGDDSCTNGCDESKVETQEYVSTGNGTENSYEHLYCYPNDFKIKYGFNYITQKKNVKKNAW